MGRGLHHLSKVMYVPDGADPRRVDGPLGAQARLQAAPESAATSPVPAGGEREQERLLAASAVGLARRVRGHQPGGPAGDVAHEHAGQARGLTRVEVCGVGGEGHEAPPA